MRILVAACTVTYSGRLSTSLPLAVRAIVMKSGSIAVHAESNGIKPLNWMTESREIDTPDPALATGPVVWRFANPKEELLITLHDVHSDVQMMLDHHEPGLTKIGTELQLQAFLAEHPDLLGDGVTLVAREHPTGHGPVDLLCAHPDGGVIAVEVKRTASMLAVDQVTRYTAALDPLILGPVRGMIVAYDVRPRARKLAEQRGFAWVQIDRDTLTVTGTSG